MILRGHITPAIRLATLRELARMVHKAEDTDDDILSLGIMEEMQIRDAISGGVATEVFRQHYIEQMRHRFVDTSPARR